VTVLIGGESYPENIIEELSEKNIHLKSIDAYNTAKGIGNFKVQNSILLGALVKACALEELNWSDIIKRNVNDKYFELNIKAFNMGVNLK